MLRDRSWRWLRARIAGLLSCESRLSAKLDPPDKHGKHGKHGG